MIKEKRLINNILHTLHEKSAITPDIKTILTPNGPSPVCLHRLPKSHKVLVDGLPNYRTIICQCFFSTWQKVPFYTLNLKRRFKWLITYIVHEIKIPSH